MCCKPGRQKAEKNVGRVGRLVRPQVAVSLDGQNDCGMPHSFLNHVHRDARQNLPRAEGVPKGVEVEHFARFVHPREVVGLLPAAAFRVVRRVLQPLPGGRPPDPVRAFWPRR